MNKKMDVVVGACHPSYTGSANRMIVVQAGLKNNKSKKEGGCGSSGRTHPWQAMFKPQYHQKRIKNRRRK
jgi:hypothetical protein